MRFRKTLVVALAIALTVGQSIANAADKWWDVNDVNVGATDSATGDANGDWNLVAGNNRWTTDGVNGTTATGIWVNADRAIFSAGTNANGTIATTGSPSQINISAAVQASGILIEEGEIVLGGASAVTVAPGGIVELTPNTILSTNSSARIAAAVSSATVATVQYKLNGPTSVLKSTNTGFAGSFVDGDAQIVLNGGGKFIYDGGAQLNIIAAQTGVNTAVITGTGPLIVDATIGALAIAGAATYTGETQIIGGELRIRTSNDRLPIATAVNVQTPGVLNLNGLSQQIGSLTGNGNVGTAGGTLTINGSTSSVFDGALVNTANFNTPSALASTAQFGRLVKSGTGVITFNGVNDINGSVTLNAGGIIVGPTASLCGDVADLTIAGGTLTLNNGAETVENFGGTGGSVVLNNNTILTTDPTTNATAANTTYAGVISGTGGLLKKNTIAGIAKTLSLTGLNTYSGGTTIESGRVNSNSASGTGSAASAVTVNATGVLGGSGKVLGAVTINSGGQLTGGVGQGNGSSLTVDGTVQVLSGGELNLMVGAPTSPAQGDFNNNGIVDGADYVVWRNAGPTDTLPNDPTPGTVNASDYTVFRSNFGNTASLTPQADTLNITGANALTIDAGSILTVSGGGSTAPSGTYTLLKYNTGHTGSVASMALNNATGVEIGAAGSADDVVTDNTTAKEFQVTLSGVAQNRTWAAAGDGNWSFNPSEAGNWSAAGQPNGPGAIATFGGTGAKTVTIVDSEKSLGVLNLSNSSGYNIASVGPQYRLNMNTYSGSAAINVTSGAHTISAPMYISKATTATVTNASDSLLISGNVGLLAGLTKAGAGSMEVSGLITSTGSVTVSAGTLTLSGQNSYNGGTTIAAGATLIAANTVAATSATGATGANIVNGTLTVNSGARTTNPTTINAGAIENVNGTVTGAHTVAGGTLDVGTAGVISGTATMSAGGKLQNQGLQSAIQIASVAVQSTGHFAPGGIGAIGAIRSTTGGTLNFSAGGIFDIDVGSAGFDQFQYGNTTANTIGLTVASGAIMKVNDVGGMSAGVYPIIALGAVPNAATINLFNNFVFTGSAPGFTYSLSVASQTVNLTVAGPGSGSGLEGAAVPEPATFGLLGIALGALVVGRRSRRS